MLLQIGAKFSIAVIPPIDVEFQHINTSTGTLLISRDPLTDHIPLMPTKDEENLLTTQYDGRFVEDIGLLKMDFLGLKTLSIIKETLENIKISKGIEVDIETLNPPLKTREDSSRTNRKDYIKLFHAALIS